MVDEARAVEQPGEGVPVRRVAQHRLLLLLAQGGHAERDRGQQRGRDEGGGCLPEDRRERWLVGADDQDRDPATGVERGRAAGHDREGPDGCAVRAGVDLCGRACGQQAPELTGRQRELDPHGAEEGGSSRPDVAPRAAEHGRDRHDGGCDEEDPPRERALSQGPGARPHTAHTEDDEGVAQRDRPRLVDGPTQEEGHGTHEERHERRAPPRRVGRPTDPVGDREEEHQQRERHEGERDPQAVGVEHGPLPSESGEPSWSQSRPWTRHTLADSQACSIACAKEAGLACALRARPWRGEHADTPRPDRP